MQIKFVVAWWGEIDVAAETVPNHQQWTFMTTIARFQLRINVQKHKKLIIQLEGTPNKTLRY